MNERFYEKFSLDILEGMPARKKNVLGNALERNSALTSTKTLEHGTMRVYKEGFYLVLNGTRCSFSIWEGDDDDGFKYGRKPTDRKLNFLHEVSLHFYETDYSKLSV